MKSLLGIVALCSVGCAAVPLRAGGGGGGVTLVKRMAEAEALSQLGEGGFKAPGPFGVSISPASVLTGFIQTTGTGPASASPSAAPAWLGSTAANYAALYLGVAVPSGTNYAVKSSSAGDTTVNAASGQAVAICVNNGNCQNATATGFTIAGKLNMTSGNSGTITLSAGSGTAAVTSGAKCICTDSTANASVKCAVASTTLTATGTSTDVITYVCDK